MADRASIFDDAPDFDVSGFTPAKPTPAPASEAVRKVAESTSFQSREPEKKSEKGPERKARRVYRTGRNAQFFCKAAPEVVEKFYAISNAQEWVMGETLDRAVAALERELAGQG